LRPIGDLTSVLEDLKARDFGLRLLFDVGASDGFWTKLARSVFPDVTSVLLEPRPAAYEALAAYCRETPRSTPIRAGAGATIGTATLTDWGTGSTILPVDAGDAAQFNVALTTLDAVAEQHGVPELVKLDVEGFELEVMKGASRLLGATEIFIIEVALFRFVDRPMLHDVVAFMAARDYYAYDIAGFVRRPHDGAVGLVDLCFVRGNGPLHASAAWS
jgi:FkbM family methyltransferase